MTRIGGSRSSNFFDKYRASITKSGDQTLYSILLDEHFHSLDGAEIETYHHHVFPSGIEKLASIASSISLLEVGFGTGMGLKVTLESLVKKKLFPFINYIALEIDEDLLLWSKKNTSLSTLAKTSIPDPFQTLIKNQFSSLDCYTSDSESYSIKVFLGNGRETFPLLTKMLNSKFDIIYQDPFSPKKCPELWSVEWFRILKEYSKTTTTLTTYSASSAARKSMIAAGWVVRSSPGIGMKKDITICKTVGESDINVIEHLSRSPVPAIYDKSLLKE